MERKRVRSVIPAALGAALTLVGPGCIHVHTDRDGAVKSVEWRMTPTPTATEVKTAAKVEAPGKPATSPAALVSSGSVLPKLPSMLGGGGGASGPAASEISVAWQNRLAHLPDPTRNGAAGAGLVGQMFLFGSGPKMPFAPADGKLTIELYDESPRPGGPAEPTRLGIWTFDKETLKKLVTTDERFGKCYALFLPWPDYRPDITRIKLTTKYEPDSGHPLFAAAASVTLDNSAPGSPPGGAPLVAGPAPGPMPPMPAPVVPSPVLAPAAPVVTIPPAAPGATVQPGPMPTTVPVGTATSGAAGLGAAIPVGGAPAPVALPAPTPLPATAAPAPMALPAPTLVPTAPTALPAPTPVTPGSYVVPQVTPAPTYPVPAAPVNALPMPVAPAVTPAGGVVPAPAPLVPAGGSIAPLMPIAVPTAPFGR
jgi:hypothetical protein